MRLCEWSGCARPHSAKGFCTLHYSRFKSGKNMDAEPQINYELCTIEGCGSAHHSKGFCALHYQRHRIGKPMDDPIHPNARKPQYCKHEDCKRPVYCFQFCLIHYQRDKKKQNMNRPFKGLLEHCQHEDCTRPLHAWDLCSLHYSRAKNGIPLDKEIVEKAETVDQIKWYKNKDGYVNGSFKGKFLIQHRFVMEQHLGRPLHKFENVHHLNGIRDDNRIENLELWTRPQAIGQRPENLVAWVIDHYRELVEARLALF
jgi:hypothetical protein